MWSNATPVIARAFILSIVIAGAGCGRQALNTPPPTLNTGSPAPNPNGCYVMVFDQPTFSGMGDVFNRSGRWGSLQRLTDTRERTWHNRIRSVRTGFSATATFFTGPNFTGESLQLAPGTDRPQFEGRFAKEVASLEIGCNR